VTVGTGLLKGGIEMFDKLIESNTVEAEFKPRRKFFMVSSVVVGILFLTAVVASLYAHDINLGTNDFDMAELLAPIAPDVPEPEPPRPQQQQRTEPQESELPNRQHLIANINQTQPIPNEISTTPNTQAAIPETGRYTFDKNRPDRNGVGNIGAESRPQGTCSGSEVVASEPAEATQPPPVVPPAPKRPTTISKGVVNGTAIDLPKPAYPAVARAVNLTGSVNVQVLIDESGNVVSAKAVDGHPFFRLEAERAARRAKFKPTLLSEVPVKVTGIIVYRFMK